MDALVSQLDGLSQPVDLIVQVSSSVPALLALITTCSIQD